MVDEIDKRLLFELNWDCRRSNSEIGKKLRVSKQVINYRIEKLEKEEFIQGYSTLIDWRKLGFNAIRVYIKWKNITLEKEQEIYNYIKKDPFFMWTMKFEGEFDIAFYIWTKNIPEFAQHWKEFLIKYKKYVLKQEISESISMEHYPMKDLVKNFSSKEKIIGLGEPVKFDKKDYELLKIISDNARLPIIKISSKMRLTPKAVIYRLKNLEKKGIVLGYNAIINTNKLNYVFYKVDFYLNDLKQIEEMVNYARNHKNIVYLVKTVGGPDYEIEIFVKDVFELNKIIKDIRKNFQKVIDYYRFHRFEETIKQVYLPGEMK